MADDPLPASLTKYNREGASTSRLLPSILSVAGAAVLGLFDLVLDYIQAIINSGSVLARAVYSSSTWQLVPRFSAWFRRICSLARAPFWLEGTSIERSRRAYSCVVNPALTVVGSHAKLLGLAYAN